MAVKVEFLHPFDSHAGSQRVTGHLVEGLRRRSVDVRLNLGFGTRGFLTDAKPDYRFLPFDKPAVRKMLYPLWLAVENMRSIIRLGSDGIVWPVTVYALPAILPVLMLQPHRVVMHVHELTFSPIFRWLLGFATSRGARLVVVSAYHQRRLGLKAEILPNAVGSHAPGEPATRGRLIFVGTSQAMKGFPLFVEVASRLPPEKLEPIAFLADTREADRKVLIAAEGAGVRVVRGEADPARMFDQGFLTLQLTDPDLWDETFSLVTAESLWQLVPVGAAGSSVVGEVAGEAMAFNQLNRDPAEIVHEILALIADPIRYRCLVEAARERRGLFSTEEFLDRAESVLDRAST